MEAGMLLRNRDLAAVLRDIGGSGIRGFYRGEIAAAIVAAIGRRDGLVTAADLGSHRSSWVEPVAMNYRDATVYELPPPTQGLTALAIMARLSLLERADLEPGPRFVERFKRARDTSYALRDRYITDPDFAVAPMEPFLDPSQAAVGGAGPRDGGDTVYLCAADEHWQLVSLIPSVAIDIRSGSVADGTQML